MTEKEIIDGCISGDANAQRTLYECFGATMFGICYRYVKDREVAEDLLHDGFITIFSKISEFRNEGSFEGWCKRIFVNTALAYLRKRNPLNMANDITEMVGISNNEHDVIEKMSATEVMNMIARLPDGYRTILNLYAVEGYSHKEIGEMMGISETTSRSQYFRARGRLMEEIEKLRVGERVRTV